MQLPAIVHYETRSIALLERKICVVYTDSKRMRPGRIIKLSMGHICGARGAK